MATFSDKIIVGVMLAVFSGCMGHSKKNIPTGVDTSKIVISMLNDKDFLKDLAPLPDTLYIVRSDLVNTSWPVSTSYAKIVYMKQSPEAMKANRPGDTNMYYLKKVRLGIPKMVIRNDTAYTVLSCFNWNAVFEYTIVRENNTWKIVHTESSIY